MASGRETQLTRQIGEYLVAAELGRRGWIATTFTGSVPGFDILAINPDGRMIEVQVKAIRSASWQLNASHLLDIELRDGEQFVRGPKTIASAQRLCVFVVINAERPDDFFIFRWSDLQALLLAGYKGGRRKINPSSFHFALYRRDIEQYRDNWIILEKDM